MLLADRVAGAFVRVGGLLVIVAVVGILVFLVATVLPLFRPAEVRSLPVAGRVPVAGALRLLRVDEYRLLAAAVGDAPEVVYFRPETGDVVSRTPIAGLEGATVASARSRPGRDAAVVAAKDGRLAFLDLGFASDFVLDDGAAAIRERLAENESEAVEGGVVRRVAGGNLRRVRPLVRPRGVARVPADEVVDADVVAGDGTSVAMALGADGAVHVLRDPVDAEGEVAPVRLSEEGPVAPPGLFAVHLDDDGRTAWLPSRQGAVLRVDLAPESPVRREVRIVEGSGRERARLTASALLLGSRSLLLGDDEGRVSVWSLVRNPDRVRLEEAAARERKRIAKGHRDLLDRLAEVPPPSAEAREAWEALRALAPGAAVPPTAIATVVAEGGDPRLLDGLLALERAETAAAALVAEAERLLPHVLAELHRFGATGSAVRVLAASPVRRGFYVGRADGTLDVCHATNDRVVARESVFRGPVSALAVGAKDDGLLVAGPGQAYRGYDVENPHPEANVRGLFLPVHYEGYDAAGLEYQSSSGAQEAEPKLSLTPLLFGTFKGTFYAMLFAVPLALLAALYTSDFMHKRVRAWVKPGIEVMASLPSVVLGFVAALVLAPAIAAAVPAVLGFLLALPAIGFLAGVGWHALPADLRFGLSSRLRLLLSLALVGGALAAALAANGALERWFFGGDFAGWLRGEAGEGTRLLGLGLAFLGGALGLFLLPRLSLRLVGGRTTPARTFLEGVASAAVLAAGLALLAPAVEDLVFSGDFRAFLTGPEGMVYDQRNSFVVGIAMGFAVIPVVYTIAEDALSAIPQSLRSASLGCGASPWQTAIRVVVPAAVPGIFSAVMIGLGRAVGETMIVLMATGGTPIIDLSMFNGFRSLSQNIATELPEAPQGGTLYRVLFLAGLLLFALTFALNTVAEAVRLRFRRKFRGL